jgi:hypothetical protein
MKITIVALSAAALIAAAPAAFAQDGSSKAPDQHRHASTKHHRTISGYDRGRAMHATRMKTGYPRTLGYAPSEPKDYSLENSRQAGGGGGGGGSGM